MDLSSLMSLVSRRCYVTSQSWVLCHTSDMSLMSLYSVTGVLPSLVAIHHDLTSPIQYVLTISVVFNQLVSWLLSDGRPMSVKTANDPPRDKHSLLALHHVCDLWNIL